jgi:hypothetical protein
MANYEDIPEVEEEEGPTYLDYSTSAKNNYYDSEYAGSDNYMEASGTYTESNGYVDGSEESEKPGAPAELPEFLKQDAMQRKILEAQKTKASFMKYHQSPLLSIMKEKMKVDWEPPTGSWNERFQVRISLFFCRFFFFFISFFIFLLLFFFLSLS